MKSSSITTSTFQLKDAVERGRPGDGLVQRGDEDRDGDAAGRARVRRHVHRDRQGRRRRRRPTRSATPLAADVSWSFTIEASPPQMLVVTSTARPFGSYLGEILQRRGPERVHDDRRRLPLAGAAERLRRRRCSARRPLNAAQVTTLTGWVERRRQPDRDAPRQAARRPARPHRRRAARARTPTSRSTRHVPPERGSSAARSSTTAPPTTTPSTARPPVATLYSSTTTATTNPAVTLRSVGSNGGQAAAFTYDLARSVVYTRQGNPAWAGPGARRRLGHPPRRHVLLDAG